MSFIWNDKKKSSVTKWSPTYSGNSNRIICTLLFHRFTLFSLWIKCVWRFRKSYNCKERSSKFTRSSKNPVICWKCCIIQYSVLFFFFCWLLKMFLRGLVWFWLFVFFLFRQTWWSNMRSPGCNPRVILLPFHNVAKKDFSLSREPVWRLVPESRSSQCSKNPQKCTNG